MSGCPHPELVCRQIPVQGTRSALDWQSPIYSLRVLACSRCGALQPDASSSEVVSANRGEEESSPPTED
jgi:hypothetical protein